MPYHPFLVVFYSTAGPTMHIPCYECHCRMRYKQDSIIPDCPKNGAGKTCREIHSHIAPKWSDTVLAVNSVWALSRVSFSTKLCYPPFSYVRLSCMTINSYVFLTCRRRVVINLSSIWTLSRYLLMKYHPMKTTSIT